MVVEFLSKFSKDLDKINQKNVKDNILKVIHLAEKANSISEIPGHKKLSGFKTAYRIRIGDYRIGVFVTGNIVQFARVANRKEIYRLFP